MGDHRIKVTKMLIRRAFTDLISKKPIQSISVKELCEAAGINRGTFYAHYTDIYDLLEKLEAEMMEDFKNSLQPVIEANSIGEFVPHRIITGVFQTLKDNADICAVTLGTYGDKEFAAKIINYGRTLYMKNYTKFFAEAPEKELEFCYAYISSGCIGLLEKWLDDGMTADAEYVAGLAEGLMEKGIGYFTELNHIY